MMGVKTKMVSTMMSLSGMKMSRGAPGITIEKERHKGLMESTTRKTPRMVILSWNIPQRVCGLQKEKNVMALEDTLHIVAVNGKL